MMLVVQAENADRDELADPSRSSSHSPSPMGTSAAGWVLAVLFFVTAGIAGAVAFASNLR